MTSITGEYLLDIITRCISKNIAIRRKLSIDNTSMKKFSVTNEERIDFILSIPYFDARLKDFLLGNLNIPAIIISQTWENEFIKKCVKWSNDKQWLESQVDLFNIKYRDLGDYDFTLPY